MVLEHDVSVSLQMDRPVQSAAAAQEASKPKHHHGARGNAFSHDVTPRQVIEARRR
ncbi:hypothetical protein [Edwardsiella anguillarum]|uniref:Uncharacterized protein n=1 Tax=Edwardsiella anguillarum ET080813 TaxID=667120 RepID=A0A076LTM5_9GAMM|nr:hypothetical protein [Edwardsiella anguillarum]AIJ10017.1 Hypothetical protein ETEE_3597 [Edwardsiella anguillarum ET080813]WHP89259.1 hypothetical protein MQ088_08775 [Edwardsiella anguillarum]